MRPRVRHNVLYEEEEEKGYGYSPKTFPSRLEQWMYWLVIIIGSWQIV